MTMFDLQAPSPKAWVDAVMGDFDAFLVDHASCERKASATGMSFIVRYPDRVEMIDELIAFAREELEHFHLVYKIMEKRGLRLAQKDEKDPYVNRLMKHVRNGSRERMLDRFVMAAIVEARGCERFALVADALPEGELKEFYMDIARSEARHHGFFLRLARHYFEQEEIDLRYSEFLRLEGEIMLALPIRAALH